MPSDDDSPRLLINQGQLQAEAERLRAELDLNELLGSVGRPVVVGSAALGLMAWRDLDMTVVCDRLDHDAVLAVVATLGRMDPVREVRFRDDTGRWNTDPGYPDGLFIGVDCRSEQGERWSLDLWFVDEPGRQPDLGHLRDLAPRLDDETRLAILIIKDAWCRRPEYGSSVTSFGIYNAVLDHGVRTVDEFNRRRDEFGDRPPA